MMITLHRPCSSHLGVNYTLPTKSPTLLNKIVLAVKEAFEYLRNFFRNLFNFRKLEVITIFLEPKKQEVRDGDFKEAEQSILAFDKWLQSMSEYVHDAKKMIAQLVGEREQRGESKQRSISNDSNPVYEALCSEAKAQRAFLDSLTANINALKLQSEAEKEKIKKRQQNGLSSNFRMLQYALGTDSFVGHNNLLKKLVSLKTLSAFEQNVHAPVTPNHSITNKEMDLNSRVEEKVCALEKFLKTLKDYIDETKQMVTSPLINEPANLSEDSRVLYRQFFKDIQPIYEELCKEVNKQSKSLDSLAIDIKSLKEQLAAENEKIRMGTQHVVSSSFTIHQCAIGCKMEGLFNQNILLRNLITLAEQSALKNFDLLQNKAL